MVYRKAAKCFSIGVAVASFFLASSSVWAISETYQQTFDSLTDGATISGQDSWAVSAGNPVDAMVQSGETSTGGGKALKLSGAETPASVVRPASYGNLSPTWVEYVVKAPTGVDPRDVPTSGIAAVNFGSTGNIMVSDGSSWIDTGKAYSSSTWYRILLKLDFSTHLYDLYAEPASSPQSPFIPTKQNLHFIDPTVNSMSQVGFAGGYSLDEQADSLVDEVVVHYVDKLQFTTSPQTLVNGHPSGLITVQLQSANSEPQTAWHDITLELRSSAQNGEFSLDQNDWVPLTSVILSEGAQQVAFFYKDFGEGKPTLSVNEYPDRGWTDANQEQKVVSEGEFFTVTADPVQTAGEPFVVHVAAMDGYGGTNTGYTGGINLYVQYVTPQTGTKFLAPDNAAGFILGAADVTVSYPDAGVVKLVAQDQADSAQVGYSGDILFLPESFEVTADPVQIVGKNFPVSIKALGKDGQGTPNYQGPALIEPVAVNPASTSGGAFNPVDLPAGSFTNGAVTMNTAYNRWGMIDIQASDSAHPEKKGVSAPVQFVPKSVAVTVKPPSLSRSFFYAGENMEITISMLGQDGLPIENFAGNVSLTAVPPFEIQSQATFSEADKGQKKFVVPSGGAGKYHLKVEDVADNLETESDEFEVKDATIVISNTSSPVGAASVEIQLVDKDGKRIKEESEMTITILVQEENENGSVFFSELGKPILFKKGVARIVLGDNEAETVTISAVSKFGLKVSKGKVIFGRTGATGVGTLMLRESKD